MGKLENQQGIRNMKNFISDSKEKKYVWMTLEKEMWWKSNTFISFISGQTEDCEPNLFYCQENSVLLIVYVSV